MSQLWIDFQLDNDESTAGTVKKSVSSFFSQLWEPITIDDQLSPMVIKDSEPVCMTDLQVLKYYFFLVFILLS